MVGRRPGQRDEHARDPDGGELGHRGGACPRHDEVAGGERKRHAVLEAHEPVVEAGGVLQQPGGAGGVLHNLEVAVAGDVAPVAPGGAPFHRRLVHSAGTEGSSRDEHDLTPRVEAELATCGFAAERAAIDGEHPCPHRGPRDAGVRQVATGKGDGIGSSKPPDEPVGSTGNGVIADDDDRNPLEESGESGWEAGVTPHCHDNSRTATPEHPERSPARHGDPGAGTDVLGREPPLDAAAREQRHLEPGLGHQRRLHAPLAADEMDGSGVMAAGHERFGHRQRRLHMTAGAATGKDGEAAHLTEGCCRRAIPSSRPAPAISATRAEPP